jgi:hypothetical protein
MLRRSLAASTSTFFRDEPYLKGFWNRGIVAKAGKNSQKSYGQKICGSAFTLTALNIMAP